MLFNQNYENNIHGLFNAFTSVTEPFASAVLKDEIQDIEPKDIDSYYIDAQIMKKPDFYKFIYEYVDLYKLWDEKLLEFVLENDELAVESLTSKGKKPETIKQIIAKR